MKKEIDRYGTIKYYNDQGQYHRDDGPALEHASGHKEWRINGRYHRDDGGPAVEYNGTKYWYINDKLHRLGGPAIEYADGTKYWFINDVEMTEQEFWAHPDVLLYWVINLPGGGINEKSC